MIVDYYVKSCGVCGEDRATRLYRKGDDGEKHWHDMCSPCERRVEITPKCELPEDPSVLKRCPRCAKELPATHEFFYHNSSGSYGLSSYCIPCTKEYNRNYYRNY